MREKREPSARVTGYIARRRVSREVGRRGVRKLVDWLFGFWEEPVDA